MSHIILSASDSKEIEDHKRALSVACLDDEQFFALRAPWNPENIARDYLVSIGLLDADYDRTALGNERLATYWRARTYKPDHTIVDVVMD